MRIWAARNTPANHLAIRLSPLRRESQTHEVSHHVAHGESYGSAHCPNMTNPSPSPAAVADIFPLASLMSTVHPRSPSAPLSIILLFARSRLRMEVSRGLSAPSSQSFMALTSTLKSAGKFTFSALRRWHLPSATPSLTVIAAQISGAAPSYFPAAALHGGDRPAPATPRTARPETRSFTATLRSFISGPC